MDILLTPSNSNMKKFHIPTSQKNVNINKACDNKILNVNKEALQKKLENKEISKKDNLIFDNSFERNAYIDKLNKKTSSVDVFKHSLEICNKISSWVLAFAMPVFRIAYDGVKSFGVVDGQIKYSLGPAITSFFTLAVIGSKSSDLYSEIKNKNTMKELKSKIEWELTTKFGYDSKLDLEKRMDILEEQKKILGLSKKNNDEYMLLKKYEFVNKLELKNKIKANRSFQDIVFESLKVASTVPMFFPALFIPAIFVYSGIIITHGIVTYMRNKHDADSKYEREYLKQRDTDVLIGLIRELPEYDKNNHEIEEKYNNIKAIIKASGNEPEALIPIKEKMKEFKITREEALKSSSLEDQVSTFNYGSSRALPNRKLNTNVEKKSNSNIEQTLNFIRNTPMTNNALRAILSVQN